MTTTSNNQDDELAGGIQLRSEEEPKDEADLHDEEKQDDESIIQESDIDNGAGWPFPAAFYDPDTKRIMLDPVVHPDGESYEKSEESDIKVYPNRALRAYIEQELDRYSEAGSARELVQEIGETLRSGWNKLVEQTPLPAREGLALPEAFYCVITFELIHEPVVDPEGNSYEKAAIEHWIRANGTSPVTRQELTIDQLYPNNALLSVLTELTENDSEDVHPSIRRWKEDHATRQFTSIVPEESETERDQQTYPTTQAELDERRRQRRQNNCTTFGILLVMLIVFLFFPSYFFLFTIIIACAWFLHEPYRQRQQLLRRQMIRNAAIQEMRREDQQQQEQ